MSKKMKLPVTAVVAVMGIIEGFVSRVSTNFSEINFQKSDNFSDEWEQMNESIPEFYGSLNSEFGNLSDYCDVRECRGITCRDIPEGRDVGVIVSGFISSTFHVQCPHETQISSLRLKNCSFSGGKLNSHWLTTQYSVIDLTFEDCGFTNIESNAFSSAFEATKRLAMINTGVKKLRKHMFQGFGSLASLTIRNCPVDEADYNLLENVADVLENIELNESINDVGVLKNITSGRKLSNVQLISMRGNTISKLSSEILSGFPNVRSIYLDSSKIKSIDADAFQSFNSLEQIYLNNNSLSTLPANTFDTIISINRNLRVIMSDNPWNCSCSFVWIQMMIRNRPNLFENIPKCTTPERNSGLNFLDADFCGEIESTSVTNPPESSIKKIDCPAIIDNRNSSSIYRNYRLSAKIGGFYVEYCNNGSVLVHVEPSNNPQSLIWFRNSRRNNSIIIDCLIVNNSIILGNVQRHLAYTVCLLEETRGLSPLNCLAMTPGLAVKRGWLGVDDKPAAIVIVLAITSLAFVIGGVFSFLIVLKNPHLIRGSHRVIMVKRGRVDAMILPKGVLWHEVDKEKGSSDGGKFENNLRSEYLTPISRSRSLIFQGNYYDTIKKSFSRERRGGIQPQAPVERGWKAQNSESYDVPPPLPPYPRREREFSTNFP
ncbi:uncharacterized protein LOC135165719 [Diachasmimorpha longicaudata]|uniref:uncharacterized protein LOC135165719 n=1 Tax=Diachasmimorpha longicaudata TaxID=58733 RepID=UPI0030B893FC